ncbi:hypothetical protein ACA081_00185 [Candidatus Hodgkinia cicadicola]
MCPNKHGQLLSRLELIGREAKAKGIQQLKFKYGLLPWKGL